MKADTVIGILTEVNAEIEAGADVAAMRGAAQNVAGLTEEVVMIVKLQDRDAGVGGYDFSRFFFNLGKKNGVSKRTIIDLINQNLPDKSVEIGSIEVLKSFSFFEVDKRYEKEVLNSFKNAKYKGQRIGIDIAKGK